MIYNPIVIFVKIYFYSYLSVWGYAHVNAHGGQKRESEPLELELQVVVSLPV